MKTDAIETTQNKTGSLIGRDLYIPRMSVDGAAAMAASYRAVGVNGQLVPEADARTIELARQYTIGEECYPEIVTLGSFLKIIEHPDFDPQKTAFLLPTANGPCRFGQYKQLLKKVLDDNRLTEVMVVSPSSADGYEGFSEQANILVRLAWMSLVCADGLRKLLLQTRPYEKNAGDSDKVHAESLELLCSVIEKPDVALKDKLWMLTETMNKIKQKFEAIPAEYTKDKPLIGVVGEIYCRLDDFTNADLIRRIENFGGEVWLASIAEWVFYTNFMQKQNLKFQGQRFTKEMLGSIIRTKVQEKDEHHLFGPLRDRFRGYEEPSNIKEFVKPAEPYAPYWGALGEMVLNVSGAIHLYEKGADGIVDISPFSCMNGIVCEAIYPRVSKDYDDFPIRNFYFDGTESDYDRDVEIFLELARTYQRRKKIDRVYPPHFSDS